MASDMKAASNALKGAGVQLLESIGEGIGSGANPLQSILKTIPGFLGDFMVRIGSALAR